MAGLLSGMISGLGGVAAQQAHSMLEAQMSRYKNLAQMYHSIASNPNVAPEVAKEAYRRAIVADNVNPMVKGSQQAAKGIEDTTDLWNAHDASLGLGQPGPSLNFQSAASGQSAAPQTSQTAPQQPQLPDYSALGAPSGALAGGGGSAAPSHPNTMASAPAPSPVQSPAPTGPAGPPPSTTQFPPIQDEYVGGMHSASIAAQNKAVRDRQAAYYDTLDKGHAELALVRDRMNLFGGINADPVAMEQARVHQLTGQNAEPHYDILNWDDETGHHDHQQVVSVNGKAFDPVTHRPITPKNGFSKPPTWHVVGPDGQFMDITGDTPVAKGVKRGVVSRSSVTEQDALNGVTRRATVASYNGGGSVPSGSSIPSSSHGGQTYGPPSPNLTPPAANAATPAAGGTTSSTGNPNLQRALTNPATADDKLAASILFNPASGTELRGLAYRQANSKLAAYGLTVPNKETFTGPAIAKEQSAYGGMQAMHDLVQVTKENPDIGPIAGRIGRLINEHFASTKLLAGVHTLQGLDAVNDDQLLDYVNTISHDPASIQKIASTLGMPEDRAAKAAQRLAYALTRSRALNAAETASIAGGGGRGITRLFMMMTPYMTNITQDPNFLAGHGGAIVDLLGSDIAQTHISRWGQAAVNAIPSIPPQRQALLKEFGQMSKITGEPTVNNAPSSGKTITKTDLRKIAERNSESVLTTKARYVADGYTVADH